MRTVFRIYQNKDGSFEGEQMMEGLSHSEDLQVLGLIGVLKSKIESDFEHHDMSDGDVEKSRKLVD
jgi:hypothetical protein